MQRFGRLAEIQAARDSFENPKRVQGQPIIGGAHLESLIRHVTDVIQQPAAPFGVSWYQTDIHAGSTGTGAATVRGVFDSETFSVSPGGTTTFAQAVGGVGTPLVSLNTDAVGTTHVNGGSVRTSGGQIYGDAVQLGADTTFTSTAAGASNAITILPTCFARAIRRKAAWQSPSPKRSTGSSAS